MEMEKQTPQTFFKRFGAVIIGLHAFVAALLVIAWVIYREHPETRTTPVSVSSTSALQQAGNVPVLLPDRPHLVVITRTA